MRERSESKTSGLAGYQEAFSLFLLHKLRSSHCNLFLTYVFLSGSYKIPVLETKQTFPVHPALPFGIQEQGENNVERPSRTSCPDGYNFWHLEPCRLSCWLWGADSLYFGCGFVSVVDEGIANAVCLLQLSLLSMLGSSKVQRKVVYYYCMWVAEGQTHSLDFDAWFSSLWVSSCILKAQFGADQTVSEQMQLEWG